ncbi:hypothetical protein [Sorangium cellulosum]|nr:hypothetical protein [Sorangium cellulosum]
MTNKALSSPRAPRARARARRRKMNKLPRGSRVLLDSTVSLDTLGRLTQALSVEEIAALSDDTFRNYLITYSYHLLDEQMRPYLGPNLSWVGFASWASELAGRCIRGEQFPLRAMMPAAIVSRVGRAVARGNQLVYADIAPVFRDFTHYMTRASEAERASVSKLAARGGNSLRDLVKEVLRLDPRPLREGGQALLCSAFEQYFIAAYERDPDARAERTFVANAAVGLHEQTRLDPMIDEMLSFQLVNRAARLALTPLFGLADLTRPARAKVSALGGAELMRRTVSRWPGLTETAELAEEARIFLRQVRDGRLAYAFSTRFVLALPLADDVFAVGKDVLPLDDGAMFPEHLRVFDTTDQHFRALLDDVLAWDRTPDSLAGSGASDWADLGDRLNFILDLFRSRQQNPALFANPLAQRVS